MSDNPYAAYSSRCLATAGTLIALTTLALSARLYVRAWMIRAWGSDDYLLVLSYVIFIGLATTLIRFGLHIKSTDTTDPMAMLENMGNDLIAGETLYLATNICLKLALATFFLRVVVKPWQRALVIVGVSIYVLFTTCYLFIELFKCGTPSWRKLFFPTTCAIPQSSISPLNYVAASLNCVTDWIMAMLPLSVITTLKLSKKAKLSIILLMLLGLAASIVSVVRLPLLHALEDRGSPSYASHVSAIVLCSDIETGIGIIALSLAALKPMLTAIFDTVSGSNKTESGLAELITTITRPWRMSRSVTKSGDMKDSAADTKRGMSVTLVDSTQRGRVTSQALSSTAGMVVEHGYASDGTQTKNLTDIDVEKC